MTRLFTYVAIVLALGTATLAIGNNNATPNRPSEGLLATDGAFRDGLFLGKLAAQGGKQPSLAVGRWSAEQDRIRFTAGYRRGYEAVHASTQAE